MLLEDQKMVDVAQENLPAFINPTINVLEEMTGVKSIPSDVMMDKSMLPSSEIAVVIGISGELQGAFVISAEKEVAYEMASKLMGGVDTSGLCCYEIAEAIAEFANIVAGNSMILMERTSININISPPTIVIGQGEKLRIGGSSEMVITILNSDIGEVAISLVLMKV